MSEEPGVAAEEEDPETAYQDLESWYREYLAQIVRRRLGGSLTWCSSWYLHAEAICRLNAMWQEWERALAESTMSSWWLYHCDPHLAVLMSKDSGPFMACRPGEHRELEPLPVDASPSALWASPAFSNLDDDSGTAAGVPGTVD